MLRLAAALAAVPFVMSAGPRSGPEPSREGEAALREGEAAFARRGDPTRLAAAIASFEAARAARPDDPAPDLALARAHAFRALADPGAARAALDACARAAERALRRLAPAWAEAVDRGDPASRAAPLVERAGAEPLYWLASCSMDLVRARGIAAVLSAKDELRILMERAAALDPAVDAAGPHRALGAWIAALPSAAGGGAAAARRHFDRARELAPRDALRCLREAETWAVLVQDRALFLALLDEARRDDPARPASRAPEDAIARARAEALRARVERLF